MLTARVDVETMAFSPKGGCIAVLGEWGSGVELLDTRSEAEHRMLEDHDRKLGDLDAVDTKDLKSSIHMEKSNSLAWCKTDDIILSLAFSSDGNRMAFSDQDGEVKIWNIETGRWTILPWNDNEPVIQVEFSPKDTHVAFIFGENVLELWRVQDTVPQHRLVVEEMMYRFAYSSCGGWITTAGERIKWGDGFVTLAITDAVIDNVIGLSTINRKLLLQRGAKEESTPSDDLLSGDEEETDAE
ncbi:hypothetical protein EC991_008627 [Linnemannia zychae]|nr:hypothetical protein EC991_008627 [Linnemannia zychae]